MSSTPLSVGANGGCISLRYSFCKVTKSAKQHAVEEKIQIQGVTQPTESEKRETTSTIETYVKVDAAEELVLLDLVCSIET